MTIGNSIPVSALSASDVVMNSQPKLTRRNVLLGGTICAATSALGAKMVLAPSSATAQPSVPAETRAIAKEAYIYGFPLVDNYRIQHSYFVDRSGHEYKAPWNQLFNNARVYTPEDKAIQTPNSDTPYSYVGADLRAEPLVFTVPAVEKGRYYSLQFIDAYTFNFAYVGSRATGNDAGSYLLAGPNWKGEKPAGIKDILRSETDFAFILYRTQLFNPTDIENVKKIQAGYRVQPLSSFLGRPAESAPDVAFVKPLTPEQQRTSLEFFNVLNFVLQFCAIHPSEQELMARFAKIGIGAGKRFDPKAMLPEQRKAFEDGMADAWQTFNDFKKSEIDTGKLTSADITGSREVLKNNYVRRMGGTVVGIYGNSKEEAFYPLYFVDAEGNTPDGAKRYTLRFAKDQLPPVNSFWSITMYEMPASFLVANPLNRYLINSPMLPELKRDHDGGLTIYIQHESPGKDKDSNWLPAPKGPFFMAMRLYWPKSEALDGRWKAPPLTKAS